MAVTTVQPTTSSSSSPSVNREWVRENLFSPYMGEDITAIIRKRMELTNGGEQMNIPMVAAPARPRSVPAPGRQRRVNRQLWYARWIDWARNAVKTNKAEKQKDSAAIFDTARPLLSDWLKELTRDEIVDALYALVSESAPAGLNSAAGQRVNGILFGDATAAQRNTWVSDNSDRVLFGKLKSNYSATFATATATSTRPTTNALAPPCGSLKRIARLANPKIRPFKINGRPGILRGLPWFADVPRSQDRSGNDQQGRPSREGDGMKKNPIFQDGDLLDDGVIHREIPRSIPARRLSTHTAGSGGTTAVRPVWLCGQSAMAWPTARWRSQPSSTTPTTASTRASASRWPMASPRCSRKPPTASSRNGASATCVLRRGGRFLIGHEGGVTPALSLTQKD
jgi:hypothetical protein